MEISSPHSMSEKFSKFHKKRKGVAPCSAVIPKAARSSISSLKMRRVGISDPRRRSFAFSCANGILIFSFSGAISLKEPQASRHRITFLLSFDFRRRVCRVSPSKFRRVMETFNIFLISSRPRIWSSSSCSFATCFYKLLLNPATMRGGSSFIQFSRNQQATIFEINGTVPIEEVGGRTR